MSDLLPPKPEEPLPSDCCGSGCTPCVTDIYNQEMEIWRQQCAQIEKYGSVLGKDNMKESEDHAISKDYYRKYRVIKVVPDTSDTYIYRFELKPYQSLSLQPGQHLIMRWNHPEGSITRQYTPINNISVLGYFEVVIKIYTKGRMSEYIKKWEIGSMIEWRGPFGMLNYKPNQYDCIMLLAAGTGIAPMTQIIWHILNDEDNETVIYLLYSIKTYADVICKRMIDTWKDYWNFKLFLFVTQTDDSIIPSKFGEQIFTSRISQQHILSALNDNVLNSFFCICGTNSFDSDMVEFLKKLNIADDRFYKF